MTASAVIFDFDFTLADSSKGTIACANFALEAVGLRPAGADRIRQTVGLSLEQTFQVLTGIHDTALTSRFSSKFLEMAEEVVVDTASIYDDVAPVLTWVRDAGLRTGIASTKHRARIEAILARAGLAEHFDVVVGGDDVRAHKPDPEGIRLALHKLSIAPGDALYVGDHVVDAQAAARSPVEFVAVLSGTCDRPGFQHYPARAVIERLAELPPVIEKWRTRDREGSDARGT